MVTINEALKKRIIQLCEKQKISIYRLSKQSGVPQSTLNEIVQGRSRDPQFGTINRIAEGFGMQAHEFLNDPIFFDLDDTTPSKAEFQQKIKDFKKEKSEKINNK